jgi:hypothetical protein
VVCRGPYFQGRRPIEELPSQVIMCNMQSLVLLVTDCKTGSERSWILARYNSAISRDNSLCKVRVLLGPLISVSVVTCCTYEALIH